MTLIHGQVLNSRYRVDAMLGQGGMGAVYKAWDLNLNIPVAVKENLDAAKEAQTQFMHEAHILASLSHPNLPRVTDYFFIPNQGQYLVMDYVEGEDLQSMLKRMGTLPQPQVLNWISQICDALAYLHGQPSPIIHRDIKPANIRIRMDGRAMLVDFGIAKIFNPTLATTLGARAVTPGYSPPEQYGGGSTDPRSDVYALGATLYHVLSGQKPPESVQRLVAQASLPTVRQINPQISPVVDQAIQKAIEVATDRRFQTVAELRAALVQAKASDPYATISPGTVVAQASAPASSQPRAGIGPVGILSIAGLAVLLVVGGGLAIFLGPRLFRPAPPSKPTETSPVAAVTRTNQQVAPTMDPGSGISTPIEPTFDAGGQEPAVQVSVAPDKSVTLVPGQNLLKNPSFEREPGSTPPGWESVGYESDASASWSTERVLSGQHALFLATSRATESDPPGWFASVPVSQEYKYTFDVRYFTPDGAGALISVDFVDTNGGILHTLSTECTQPKSLTVWRPLKLSFVPTDFPQGARLIRLGLRQCVDYTQYKRTTLFYDDVSLTPAKP